MTSLIRQSGKILILLTLWVMIFFGYQNRFIVYADHNAEHTAAQAELAAADEEFAATADGSQAELEANARVQKALAGVKKTSSIDIEKVTEKILAASTYVNGLFNPLIHFFVFQIGNFLGNDYIYGGNMGGMLKNLWIVTRNIVNIVFVLILLAIAFMNVVQPGSESNFALKKMLPKFALLLIAVNFSWLMTRVVLDAANVATNVVFAIPSAVKPATEKYFADKQCEKSDKGRLTGPCVVGTAYYPLGADEDADIGPTETCPTKEYIQANYKQPAQPNEFFNKRVFCWKTMDLSDFQQNTASIMLSHGVIKIQRLGQVNQGGGAAKLLIGTVFALAMQIVFLAAFAVLWIVLIVRVAVLWILVAFSPLFVLAWMLKDFQATLPEQLSFNTFLEYAFVPAKVGVVFSVGFLMIAAGQTMTSELFNRELPTGKGGGIILDSNSLFAGLDGIQEFIWLIMVIIIVWVGTFTALEKTSIITKVVNPINEYGKRLGGWVTSVPKWVPIIPLYGKDGHMRHTSLQNLDLARILEEKRNEFVSKSHDQSRVDRAARDLKANHELRNELAQMARSSPGKSTGEKIVHKLESELKLSKNELSDETTLREFLNKSGYTNQTEIDNIVRAVRARYGGDFKATTPVAETPPPPPAPPAGEQATVQTGQQTTGQQTSQQRPPNLVGPPAPPNPPNPASRPATPP